LRTYTVRSLQGGTVPEFLTPHLKARIAYKIAINLLKVNLDLIFKDKVRSRSVLVGALTGINVNRDSLILEMNSMYPFALEQSEHLPEHFKPVLDNHWILKKCFAEDHSMFRPNN
jgi:hypothetical protein